MNYSFRNISRVAFLGVATFLGSTEIATASCEVTTGRVSIVGNEYAAFHTIVENAKKCATAQLEITANITKDYRKVNLPGMKANPAEYTATQVTTGSINPLLGAGVIRPLDDLIAEYGQDIPENQKIVIDGEVRAIAYMVATQHLVYRQDVLDQVGAKPPKTYEEFLEIAEKVRAAGIMQNPVGGAFNMYGLGSHFVMMYFGMGGELFKPGTALPAVNNETGVAALEMLKKVLGYAHPDILTHNTPTATGEWEAGNAALMMMWSSRTNGLMDAKGSEPVVYENTRVGPPMTVAGGTIPASALWWDGWAIAENISDEDAAASFVAMKNGTSPSILNDETMGQTVWLIEGYQPAPVNLPVLAAIEMGTRRWPATPYIGIMNGAAGKEIADFITGKQDAASTLADIEAAYEASAREKGFLE
jgi:ABC-type glycerol-3-phosphate transport system substrate-binding protein